MNASHKTSKTFQSFRRVGAIAALALGLLAARALPAAAQISPLRAWGDGISGQMGNGKPIAPTASRTSSISRRP